jgi:hypothetical protein
MPLARFVAFHELPEPPRDRAAPLSSAVMVARSRDGVAERELLEESGCVARNSRWFGAVEVQDGRTHFGGVITCEVDEVPREFANEEIAAVGHWRRESSPHPLGDSDAALPGRFG